MAKINIRPEYRDLLRPLTAFEFDELCNSIKTSGQIVPILVNAKTGVLLDGHHRLAACKKLKINPRIEQVKITADNSELDIVIDSNQKRRHLSTIDNIAAMESIRKILQAKASKAKTSRLKSAKGTEQAAKTGEVNERLAKKLGISRSTYDHGLQVLQSKNPEIINKVQNGSMTINKGYGKIKLNRKIETARKQNYRLRKAYKQTSIRWKIINGDFRHVKDIKDVNMLFTDPPYDKESIHLYRDLGHFAQRVTADKNNTSFVTYTPSYAIDQAIELLKEGITLESLAPDNSQEHTLKLNWVLSISQRNATRMHGNSVMVKNKLLLWFTKGTFDLSAVLSEYKIKELDDKTNHKWQQPIDPAAYYVKLMTRPNDLVCDPFVGSGTTGIAALMNNCRFVGIDSQTADVATGRMIEYEKENTKPVTHVAIKHLSVLPTAADA